MPLTIHHLQVSQSERLVWLAEELQIPYTLELHQRDPVFSPQSIRDLNPIGQAPVIQDGSITLAESSACAEYIINVYGNGRLALPPSDKNYADYLYWFHFVNGTLQPMLMMVMQASRNDTGEAGGYAAILKQRFGTMLSLLNTRLTENPWLAGDEFTAADVMIVFTFTTMRLFFPYDLTEYNGILAYVKKVVEREGYKKARAKADPDLELVIDGKPPQSFMERLKAQGKL